jgi:flagellar biosynthetic protein FlhB
MADDSTDDSQKTEEPTAKKLEESRKKGDVPLSREMNHWVMLLAGTILIIALAGPMMSAMSETMKLLIKNSWQLHGASGGIGRVLSALFTDVMIALLLPVLFLIIAAILGPFIQVGPLFAPESIQPKLSKISVIKGFGRLFSLRSIFEFLKGILKICLIGAISFILLYPFFDTIDHLVGLPIPYMMEEMRVMFFRMMAGVLVVLFILAVMDVVYQRMEHMKKMRMSRQEIKDEHKQTEGDPQVRARLRQLRMQRAQQRMIQNVPNADVVITNPTHFAIALQYDPETMDAPVCIAKGVDEVAARIREVAKDNDIQLVENKLLARALFDTVEIDDVIPIEHYQAVAEIISYVFNLRKGKQ